MGKRRKRKISDEEKRKNADFLSFASIAIGLLACVMCCVQSLCIILAVISILLGIYAMVSGGRKSLAIIGIVLALVGLAFGFAAVGTVEDLLHELASKSGQ